MTYNPYFLYPYSLPRESPGELEAAQKIFGEGRLGTNVVEVPVGSLVIPRFRALPFGRELEEEVRTRGSLLVNSWHEHSAVANIFSWAHLLEGLTPACYTLEDLPHLPEGAYFLKGETNSLKHSWFTSSYAPDRASVLRVADRLRSDLTTGSQQVVIRPFQAYRQLGTMVDGRPLFHERRVFTYRGRVLSDAWYWSSCRDMVEGDPTLRPALYQATLREALEKVAHVAPLLVLDLAEYPDGAWGVVELNSGPMAGLSDNDPHTLWTNFLQAVEENPS